jgi:hypothetical protein
VDCSGVWWSVVECGGVSWIVVECGGGDGVWWRWWSVVEGGCVVTSLVSIQYVIILCNDVTRASLNKDGQNLLTKHFLASLHVCDTIEGLILAIYE